MSKGTKIGIGLAGAGAGCLLVGGLIGAQYGKDSVPNVPPNEITRTITFELGQGATTNALAQRYSDTLSKDKKGTATEDIAEPDDGINKVCDVRLSDGEIPVDASTINSSLISELQKRNVASLAAAGKFVIFATNGKNTQLRFTNERIIDCGNLGNVSVTFTTNNS